jgi:hypothetical protein
MLPQHNKSYHVEDMVTRVTESYRGNKLANCVLAEIAGTFILVSSLGMPDLGRRTGIERPLDSPALRNDGSNCWWICAGHLRRGSGHGRRAGGQPGWCTTL